MPKRNTDKLLLKGRINVRVRRREGVSGQVAEAGQLQLPPVSDGTFSETLPAALTIGTPHPLIYFIELTNRNGRSAGPSNPATVLAANLHRLFPA